MAKKIVKVIALLTFLISTIHTNKSNDPSTSPKEFSAKNTFTASLKWAQENQRLLQLAGVGFVSGFLGNYCLGQYRKVKSDIRSAATNRNIEKYGWATTTGICLSIALGSSVSIIINALNKR